MRGMVDDLATIGIKNHTNITSLTVNKLCSDHMLYHKIGTDFSDTAYALLRLLKLSYNNKPDC